MTEATDQLDTNIDGYEQPKPGGWDDYPLDELAIRDERRTAMDVIRRMKQQRFVLDPDFQRGFVWEKDKQSRLIESILMRIPLPVFYVAEDNEGRLIVVDGRQRLTTLARFIDGDLKLVLPDRPELNRKAFKDLEPRMQNRVEDCQLLFYIIDRTVPERARLDIFERVNGGEVLTRQQMRNAIYNGPATTFLREESATALFIEATGNSLNTNKMQDREFVNRFCSFALLDRRTYKDMDDWLARGLKELGQLTGPKLEAFRQRFQRSLRNNLVAFRQHAFRKHNGVDEQRNRLNASLFDVMSVALSDVPDDLVKKHAGRLRKVVIKLLENESFKKSITNSPNAPQQVRGRFDAALGVIAEVFQ